ncbi:MAG TPA: hypothetical protein VIL86_21235 [Tepidisphaeraceae bacterium]|jgi:NADH dehydrogenase
MEIMARGIGGARRPRGLAAWLVWRTYYLMQMPRWNRRLRIMADWLVALLFRNDIVKLDTGGGEKQREKPAAQQRQSIELVE